LPGIRRRALVFCYFELPQGISAVDSGVATVIRKEYEEGVRRKYAVAVYRKNHEWLSGR
jgi:hypothetical protein